MVYTRMLNLVPCAIQADLVAYPSYTQQFTSFTPANSMLPVLSLSPLLPFGNHRSDDLL